MSTLEQWVLTEKTISAEAADWDIEKQSIEDLIALYRNEIASLDQQIQSAAEVTSAADRRREELNLEREQLRGFAESAERIITRDEDGLRRLVSRLPQPLQQEIAPLSQRLPAPGAASRLSLSQRMQTLIGILAQIDKFNTALTPVSELREFEGGLTVEVRTLYFGLGIAYYVDGTGRHAGYGLPGDGRWEWTEIPEIAPQVQAALDIYEKRKQADYVPLPVRIQ